jgi:hypothetical protein
LRNHKHSLSVVASRVRRLRGHGRCICMLAVVECGCVLLVKGNEYPALPRTANAVAVTAFHTVRDAQQGDMSGAADKRTVVAVHGQFMQSLFHRLPSPHNVVLHPRHNRTRHAWLSGMAWIVLRIREKQLIFSYPRVWNYFFAKIEFFSYPKGTFSYPRKLFHTLKKMKTFFIPLYKSFIPWKLFSYPYTKVSYLVKIFFIPSKTNFIP